MEEETPTGRERDENEQIIFFSYWWNLQVAIPRDEAHNFSTKITTSSHLRPTLLVDLYGSMTTLLVVWGLSICLLERTFCKFSVFPV